MKPRHDDLIFWTKWRNNQIADYLCDLTVDQTSSWRSERDVRKDPESNVIVFSGGGSRLTCSASALALGLCSLRHGRLHFEPVIVAGTFFDEPLSAFKAEAIALEHASLELVNWCKGCYAR